MSKKTKNIIVRIWYFYLDGFKDMSKWGRQVWIIILIKLFIMFAILKLFFFPDFLQSNNQCLKQSTCHW